MIQKIKIQNYRQFESLEIKGLQRVNFLIGKNNCGKTSILESLFLMTNPQDFGIPIKILRFRGSDIHQEYLTSLFKDLDEKNPVDLSIFSEEEEIRLHIAPQRSDTTFFGVREKEKKIYEYNTTCIDANNKSTQYPTTLQITGFELSSQTSHTSQIVENGFGQGVFLSTAAGDHFLRNLIEQIFKSSKETLLIENLQHFDSMIQDIILVGDVIYVDKKTVSGFLTRMPSSLMGDGFKKYLNIVLALISDDVHYIFLDEIENGLHFENIKNILRALLKLSKEKNIQLFITTHCNEVLADLSKIMCEEEFAPQKEDVGIVKISTENKQFRALNRSMDDLESFIRTETEIR